jgi:ketopantoate reductase
MRLLIYGSSPLGSYFAAHSQFLGMDALWFVESGTAEIVQKVGGVTAFGTRGRRFAAGVRVTADPIEALRPAQPYDAVLMVMPNYEVAAALMSLRNMIPPGSPTVFVSFLRGIGGHERIVSVYGAKNTIRCVGSGWVAHPLVNGKPAPELFVRLPSGGFGVAEGHALSREIAAFLTAAYWPTVMGNDQELAWSALLWQLRDNAIPALLDMTPEQIDVDPELWAIEYGELLEALGVIQALKVRLIPLPDAPIPMLATQLQVIPAGLLPFRLMHNPAPPSLRYELSQGIGRSEAAYLNGAVAIHAKDLKLETPINYSLALTLEDIANRRAVWKQFQGAPAMLKALIGVAAASR